MVCAHTHIYSPLNNLYIHCVFGECMLGTYLYNVDGFFKLIVFTFDKNFAHNSVVVSLNANRMYINLDMV